MSRPDTAITTSAVTVVAGVAGTAGWVSYNYALEVVRLAGETGAVAYARARADRTAGSRGHALIPILPPPRLGLYLSAMIDSRRARPG